ncbi:hypothetical protein V2H77_12570 [Photorhabdus sp. P32]|uniref:hypothetical protein n=1 Tax=Photorhabdus sp. P32 TaxID=3117549 RepID=UPI00311B386F
MKTLFFSVFFVFTFIFCYWWFLSMPNVFYSERDFFKYNFLTYNEIINSPRVSGDYIFEYAPNDETSPQSSLVYYCDIKEKQHAYSELIDYINKKGFLINKDDIWYKNSENDIELFYLRETTFRGKKCLALIFSKEIK